MTDPIAQALERRALTPRERLGYEAHQALEYLQGRRRRKSPVNPSCHCLYCRNQRAGEARAYVEGATDGL